jgi:hypothetical protein
MEVTILMVMTIILTEIETIIMMIEKDTDIIIMNEETTMGTVTMEMLVCMFLCMADKT